jgi:hypothetical protein
MGGEKQFGIDAALCGIGEKSFGIDAALGILDAGLGVTDEKMRRRGVPRRLCCSPPEDREAVSWPRSSCRGGLRVSFWASTRKEILPVSLEAR